MAMVHVFGPNLEDQSKGSFHVHAEGCADCKHYGPFTKNGGDTYVGDIKKGRGFRNKAVDMPNLEAIVQDVYGDIMEQDEEAYDYSYDFHVFPCVKF